MDHQKDIQKTEGAIKFLDYQTLKSSPFGDNRVGERMYRRAERIASAVVLLTNHISNSDPLRVEARKSSVDVLSSVLNVRDNMRSPNSGEVIELKIHVRKLISIVRLLGVGGAISFQNAEIVTEALDELLSFLTASRRSNLSDSVSLSREDLMDVREASRSISIDDVRTDRYTKTPGGSSDTAAPQANADSGQLAAAASSRAQAVLEILRVHGESGIRDVAAHLPEYSEKMIQRELADLVSGGKVRKTGLKRWSRYTYIV